MVRYRYTLGGETFLSKKDVEERARAIRATWKPGLRIEGGDAAFLADLLTHHPKASDKMGAGVVGFSVAIDPFGSRGLRVHRVDGSSSLFSSKGCLTDDSAWIKYCRAGRSAIADQIVAFKQAAFGADEHGQVATVVCAVTGAPMTFYDCDVDHHKPTFKALITDFDPHGWWLAEVGSLGDGHGDVFLDPDYAERWAAFHRRHARLRITTKEVNQRKAGDG